VVLPPYDTITCYYLKDLIAGKKKAIKNDALKRITIPHYEGLGIKEICNYLMQHEATVAPWLPDMIEIPRLPKDYLGNVAFTVLGDPFGQWVKAQIEERNSKVLLEKNNAVEMDPEMAAAFHQSTAVSSKYRPTKFCWPANLILIYLLNYRSPERYRGEPPEDRREETADQGPGRPRQGGGGAEGAAGRAGTPAER